MLLIHIYARKVQIYWIGCALQVYSYSIRKLWPHA
jgi:hypothetical protein